MPSTAHPRCGSVPTAPQARPRATAPRQRAVAAALRTASLAAAMLGAPEVGAMAVTADVDWTLNGITGTGSPDIDGPASSGYVDVLGSDSDANSNNVFYHTYGSTGGIFGSRVSGGGTYDINGIFTFENTYTAAGGPASFSFHIIPGQIDAQEFYTQSAQTFPTGGFVVAGYAIDIRLDGVSIWDSSGEVSVSDSGLASNFLGQSIGGSLTQDINDTWINYNWPDYYGNVGLGTFAPGDTFLLEYDLYTYSHANLDGTGCTDAGDGGDPGAPGDQPIERPTGTGCGQGIAQSGDPFDVGNGSSSSVNGVVPGPATPAIVMLGLAGLGIARLRRRV